MKKLTHLDKKGNPYMVDVGAKKDQERKAISQGEILLNPKTIALIKNKKIPKGNVITLAETSAIMAAKKTSDLIPLCHPLLLTHIHAETLIKKDRIILTVAVKNIGKTGVEMEALTGVSAGLLTIYDMCKAVDKEMKIQNIYLVEKRKTDV